ncbi:MAG TPA: type II secretion system F family protein [Chloroflexia bacterium]|nr:type II secretion system F family protein [Chloroflexia bacterium]
MPILPILTWLMITAAVFGIIAGAVLLLTSSELTVSSRVRQFVSADAPPPVATVGGMQKRKRAELFAQLDERWEKQDRGQVLAKELERANVAMTITEFTLVRLGIAVLLTLVLIVIAPQFWWAILVPALLIGFWFPRTYIRGRARRRLNRIDRQLADILNILAGSVRTGNSLFQALERVAREAEEPSRTEYMRVVRSMSLGSTLESAMANLSERIPTEDMDMLVTAITIQQQTGGNLGQILDLMATTVRERHRILREIEVLSAQQRLSAVLLACLPLAMVGLLFLINPTYIGRIFQPGWVLVMPCAVVVLLTVGFIVMNRIAAIDV